MNQSADCQIIKKLFHANTAPERAGIFDALYNGWKALRLSALRPLDRLSKLEPQFQSKLDLPRIVGSIASGTHFAKVRAGEITRTGNRLNSVAAEIRSVEVRVVKNIQQLRAELQREAFAESQSLKVEKSSRLKGGPAIWVGEPPNKPRPPLIGMHPEPKWDRVQLTAIRKAG